MLLYNLLSAVPALLHDDSVIKLIDYKVDKPGINLAFASSLSVCMR